ncbi:MAG: hypothetical protein FWG42_08075 [Clostridiales bacterium]|nr:hypothetical protein [Clostridiales bacterium]
MKKRLCVLLALCLICALAAGCADQGAAEAANTTSAENAASAGRVEKVDIDLTQMSSTMVYGEVYSIMACPDDYLGKTIKAKGPYSAQYYDVTDKYYHYLVVADSTACCSQGIEFVWNGDHNYPEDYPEEEEEIEITGVFGSYDELDRTYYYLSVEILQRSHLT